VKITSRLFFLLTIVILGSAVLLTGCIATISSTVSGDGKGDSGGGVVHQCAFEFFRAERTNTRNIQLEVLDNIINNSINQEEVAWAIEERMQILSDMTFELTVEAIIRSKQLFDDAAVSINNGNVKVMIRNSYQPTEPEAQLVQMILYEVAQGQLVINAIFISVMT